MRVTWDGIDHFDTNMNHFTWNNWRLPPLLQDQLMQIFGSTPKVSASLTTSPFESWMTLLTRGNISSRNLSRRNM